MNSSDLLSLLNTVVSLIIIFMNDQVTDYINRFRKINLRSSLRVITKRPRTYAEYLQVWCMDPNKPNRMKYGAPKYYIDYRGEQVWCNIDDFGDA